MPLGMTGGSVRAPALVSAHSLRENDAASDRRILVRQVAPTTQKSA